MDEERDNLHGHALNFRTAAPQHAEAMWQELQACVERKVAAERERWRAALAYAVEEADGWCEEARCRPVPGERMAEVRRMLAGD
jgi:hypothetical protein